MSTVLPKSMSCCFRDWSKASTRHHNFYNLGLQHIKPEGLSPKKKQQLVPCLMPFDGWSFILKPDPALLCQVTSGCSCFSLSSCAPETDVPAFCGFRSPPVNRNLP